MTKPENFILTTDFATYKNDAKGSDSVTLPGSLVIVGDGSYTVTKSIQIGTAGASERGQIHSSKLGNRYPTSQLSVNRDGSTAFGSSPYTINAEMYRSTPNILIFSVSILNPYSITLTTEAGSEIFTFFASTFIPPFP